MAELLVTAPSLSGVSKAFPHVCFSEANAELLVTAPSVRPKHRGTFQAAKVK